MSDLQQPSLCPCCGEPVPQCLPDYLSDTDCPNCGGAHVVPVPLHLVDPPRRPVRAKARRAATRSTRPTTTSRSTRKPPPAPATGAAAPRRHQVAPAQLRLAA